jgi:hypothetical protein
MTAENTESKSKHYKSQCHQPVTTDAFAEFSSAEERLVSALVH